MAICSFAKPAHINGLVVAITVQIGNQYPAKTAQHIRNRLGPAGLDIFRRDNRDMGRHFCHVLFGPCSRNNDIVQNFNLLFSVSGFCPITCSR